MVCFLDTSVSRAKTAELVEMPFAGLTRVSDRSRGGDNSVMRPFAKLPWKFVDLCSFLSSRDR